MEFMLLFSTFFTDFILPPSFFFSTVPLDTSSVVWPVLLGFLCELNCHTVFMHWFIIDGMNYIINVLKWVGYQSICLRISISYSSVSKSAKNTRLSA